MIKQNEDRHYKLWKNIKWSQICVTGVSEKWGIEEERTDLP